VTLSPRVLEEPRPQVNSRYFCLRAESESIPNKLASGLIRAGLFPLTSIRSFPAMRP
jgi:hypothetical protein